MLWHLDKQAEVGVEDFPGHHLQDRTGCDTLHTLMSDQIQDLLKQKEGTMIDREAVLGSCLKSSRAHQTSRKQTHD